MKKDKPYEKPVAGRAWMTVRTAYECCGSCSLEFDIYPTAELAQATGNNYFPISLTDAKKYLDGFNFDPPKTPVARNTWLDRYGDWANELTDLMEWPWLERMLVKRRAR